MAVLELNKENFDREVLGSKVPVLVDFYAPWCGHCRALMPIVEQVAVQAGVLAKIAKVNIDEEPELAERFQVQTIPNLHFFQGGEVKDVLIGAQSKQTIVEKLGLPPEVQRSEFELRRFTDKVVIVTGGGTGIGFGIATAFAKEGANVVITGRHMDKLEKAKGELTQYGGKVLAVAADGTKEDAVKAAVAQVAETFGRIDVLVNNAQTSKSGVLLVDHSMEDFKLAVETGLYAAFTYMRECFPYLKAAQGSVINFASGAGLSGAAGQASYAAAKEGIRGLSRVAAREWGVYGINVNVVCPLVQTEKLQEWCDANIDLCRDNISGIPMKRYGDAERDVGRTCVFLASDDGMYISGQTINVDGAASLRP